MSRLTTLATSRFGAVTRGYTTQPRITVMREMPTLPPLVNLPEIDHEMLARWRRARTFEASLKQTEGAPRWTFYEGPPTANGMPGIHHVEARVFKDLFPRFKTMQGFHVI